MNIGVFDTGTGGRLVADRLKKLLPNFRFTVIDDRINAPYGSKTDQEIELLTELAIQPLLNTTDAILLACNTATTAAIDKLRSKYSEKRFIGVEPMIKPATKLSHNRHITLLATSATKRSPKTAQLIKKYASEVTIDMPDTTDWATLIDERSKNDISFDEVTRSVASGSDVIVLGCTHYLALEERLRQQFPNCKIIEPTEAVARQIASLPTAPEPKS